MTKVTKKQIEVRAKKAVKLLTTQKPKAAYPQSGIHAALLGEKPPRDVFAEIDMMRTDISELGRIAHQYNGELSNYEQRSRSDAIAIKTTLNFLGKRVDRIIPRVIFCAFAAGLLGYVTADIIFTLAGAK